MNSKIQHFSDWNNPRDPGVWVVFCDCGYESSSFLSKREAEEDEVEHLLSAHPKS